MTMMIANCIKPINTLLEQSCVVNVNQLVEMYMLYTTWYLVALNCKQNLNFQSPFETLLVECILVCSEAWLATTGQEHLFLRPAKRQHLGSLSRRLPARMMQFLGMCGSATIHKDDNIWEKLKKIINIPLREPSLHTRSKYNRLIYGCYRGAHSKVMYRPYNRYK